MSLSSHVQHDLIFAHNFVCNKNLCLTIIKVKIHVLRSSEARMVLQHRYCMLENPYNDKVGIFPHSYVVIPLHLLL